MNEDRLEGEPLGARPLRAGPVEDRGEEGSRDTRAAAPEDRASPERRRDSGGEVEGEMLRMAAGELRGALEAVLFAASEPLPVKVLAGLFGVTAGEAREAVDTLRREYQEGRRAFSLEEVAGGWQLLTLPAYAPWVRRLRHKQREARLSAAAFETLAVIAYKQPITKADLEAIRGVQCAPILKTLMDRGLIKVVGRDETLGRPLLYGTTRRFLESFGLATLRDLPQPDVFPPGSAQRLVAQEEDEGPAGAPPEEEPPASSSSSSPAVDGGLA